MLGVALLPAFRVKTITLCPFATNAAVNACPIRPVPPVIKTVAILVKYKQTRELFYNA
jgi:hypothetical protein